MDFSLPPPHTVYPTALELLRGMTICLEVIHVKRKYLAPPKTLCIGNVRAKEPSHSIAPTCSSYSLVSVFAKAVEAVSFLMRPIAHVKVDESLLPLR